MGKHRNPRPKDATRRAIETTKKKAALRHFIKRRDKIDGLLCGDLIECEICGEIFGQLSKHLVFNHDVTIDQYKKLYPNALTVAPNISKVMSNENTKKWSDPEYKENIASQNRDFTVNHQKPRFTDTVIEVMMQGILRAHGYKFETHFRVCGICRPDIVFPEKKIAIFCGGDYWHNLPNYVKRDKNQDRVLKMNGWVSMRFWEHEIHENIQDCFRKIEAIYNDTKFIPYYRQGTLEDL